MQCQQNNEFITAINHNGWDCTISVEMQDMYTYKGNDILSTVSNIAPKKFLFTDLMALSTMTLTLKMTRELYILRYICQISYMTWLTCQVQIKQKGWTFWWSSNQEADQTNGGSMSLPGRQPANPRTVGNHISLLAQKLSGILLLVKCYCETIISTTSIHVFFISLEEELDNKHHFQIHCCFYYLHQKKIVLESWPLTSNCSRLSSSVWLPQATTL